MRDDHRIVGLSTIVGLAQCRPQRNRSQRRRLQGERFELRGINHLALVCRDMARTVDFYTNVLGMPLIKTIELPAGMGQHFFFDCGGGDALAFFWFPDAPDGVPRASSAPAGRPDQGEPDQRRRLHEPRGLRRGAREDRGVPGPPRAAGVDCTDVANHDDSEWGIADEPASRGVRPVRLLPGPRRDPARVRLLDPAARPDDVTHAAGHAPSTRGHG